MQKRQMCVDLYNLESILKLIEGYYLSVRGHREIFQKLLRHPSISALSPTLQEKILSHTINNPISLKYPPSANYKSFFLRLLLNEVEHRKFEASEALLLSYTDVIAEPIVEKKFFYCSYKIRDKFFTMQESSSIGALGTTGLKTWEASNYLSEWCIENSSIFKARRVLELGAGTGLLGCAILNFCHPSCYIFTDKDPHVRWLTETNVALNVSASSTETDENPKSESLYKIYDFDWCKASHCDITRFSPDVILGADIVFDPNCIPDLVQTLRMFLTNGTAIAVIACAIRNEDTDRKFKSELDSSGLACTIQENRSTSFPCNYISHFKLYKIFCS